MNSTRARVSFQAYIHFLNTTVTSNGSQNSSITSVRARGEWAQKLIRARLYLFSRISQEFTRTRIHLKYPNQNTVEILCLVARVIRLFFYFFSYKVYSFGVYVFIQYRNCAYIIPCNFSIRLL